MEASAVRCPWGAEKDRHVPLLSHTPATGGSHGLGQDRLGCVEGQRDSTASLSLWAGIQADFISSFLSYRPQMPTRASLGVCGTASSKVSRWSGRAGAALPWAELLSATRGRGTEVREPQYRTHGAGQREEMGAFSSPLHQVRDAGAPCEWCGLQPPAGPYSGLPASRFPRREARGGQGAGTVSSVRPCLQSCP